MWVSSVQYETSPPLREGETLCFDSSISISRKGEGFSPDAAEHASIGIIGGADGPTALFHALETESSAPVAPIMACPFTILLQCRPGDLKMARIPASFPE